MQNVLEYFLDNVQKFVEQTIALYQFPLKLYKWKISLNLFLRVSNPSLE